MNEMRDSGISTKMVSVPKGDPRGENSKPIKRGEGGGALGYQWPNLLISCHLKCHLSSLEKDYNNPSGPLLCTYILPTHIHSNNKVGLNIF